MDLSNRSENFRRNRSLSNEEEMINRLMGGEDNFSVDSFTPKIQKEMINRKFGISHENDNKSNLDENQVVVDKEEIEGLRRLKKRFSENPQVVEKTMEQEFGIKRNPPVQQQNVNQPNAQPNQNLSEGNNTNASNNENDDYSEMLKDLGLEPKNNNEPQNNQQPNAQSQQSNTQPQKQTRDSGSQLDQIRRNYAEQVTRTAMANDIPVKKLNSFIQSLKPDFFASLYKQQYSQAPQRQPSSPQRTPNLADEGGRKNVPVYSPISSRRNVDSFEV